MWVKIVQSLNIFHISFQYRTQYSLHNTVIFLHSDYIIIWLKGIFCSLSLSRSLDLDMPIPYPLDWKSNIMLNQKINGSCFMFFLDILNEWINTSMTFSTEIQHYLIAIFVSDRMPSCLLCLVYLAMHFQWQHSVYV